MCGADYQRIGMNVLYGRVMRGNNASVRVLEKNAKTLTNRQRGRMPKEEIAFEQGYLYN